MGERDMILWLDGTVCETDKSFEDLLVVPIRRIAQFDHQWPIESSSSLNETVDPRLIEYIDFVVPYRTVCFLDDAIKAGEAARKAGKVDSALNLPVGENGDVYHMEPVLTSMGGYLFGQTADGEYDPTDLGVGKPGSLDAADLHGN